MQAPTLVILAAGMGSRYGGLKQIDPIDEYGNLIIDYSIYDALKAGFGRIVCIIKEQIKDDFFQVIGQRIEKRANVSYAYQEIDALPAGYAVPEGRMKPWGTAHALLCCKALIDGPFAVINADDYYGRDAYATIYDYLCAPRAQKEHAMVGFELWNTLTDHGAVTRGVCKLDEDGYLKYIQEVSGIRKHLGAPAYDVDCQTITLKKDTIASMNLWGFDSSIFSGLEAEFTTFLDQTLQTNPLKGEYLLPTEVQALMEKEALRVRVLKCHDQWFGITYKEDMPGARQTLRALKAQNIYSEKLWE